MTTSPSDPGESRLEALERLDRLHRSGALSDAEYRAEKARLLGEGGSVAARRSPPVLMILLVVAVIALLAVASYSLFLSGEDAPEQAEVSEPVNEMAAAPPPEPVGVSALPEAEQLARAGQAAFGAAGEVTVGVETGDDYAEGEDGFEEQVAYAPGKLVWTGFGPVLLSEGEVMDAAHVSAGKIAAHYLREDGEGFALVAAYPKAVVTGSFGRVGEWNASDQFLDRHVIYAEGGGTWQGYSCAWGSLTELTPQGPREVARFATLYSDEGAARGDPRTIEGKIANIVKGRSFDIVYSGSSSFTERYVFQNGRYRLSGGGESRMETC